MVVVRGTKCESQKKEGGKERTTEQKAWEKTREKKRRENVFFLLTRFLCSTALHAPLPLWAARWQGWAQTALLPLSMLALLALPNMKQQ